MTPEEFCNRYISLAKYIATTYNNEALDLHDLLSDAIWGLHEAAVQYDGARPCSAQAWASKKINWAVLDGIRRRRGRTDRSRRRTTDWSLDAPAHPDHTGTLGDLLPSSGALDQAVDRLHVDAVLQHATDKERYVLTELYLKRNTLTEIAAVLGVTDSRVAQIRTAACTRLRAVTA